MSEIYKSSINYSYLDLQGTTTDAAPTAVCIKNGQADSTPLIVSEDTNMPADMQRWVALLGFAESQEAGPLVVRWNFEIDGTAITKEDYFEVVVPLVSVSEAREELEIPSQISDEKIVRTERRVRRVIENFTGQTFAPHRQTHRMAANRGNFLRLPERLISIESATASGFPVDVNSVSLHRDGWSMYKANPYYPGIVYSPKHVIDDPYHAAAAYWKGGAEVVITGIWGWKNVPPVVSEAALILIEEALCPESIYRERYLKTMTAADWRIEYDSGAYSGTGNVVVDQILTPYRASFMAVV